MITTIIASIILLNISTLIIVFLFNLMGMLSDPGNGMMTGSTTTTSEHPGDGKQDLRNSIW